MMNRRDFVRGPAATWAVVLLAGSFAGPHGTEAAEVGFRGTDDGRILRWDDAVRGWQDVANFGPSCRVLEVSGRTGSLRCRVAYDDHQFHLYSQDGLSWTTSRSAGVHSLRSRRALLDLKRPRTFRSSVS